MWLVIQAVKMSFLLSVAGTSTIRRGLRVEPLLLCIERVSWDASGTWLGCPLVAFLWRHVQLGEALGQSQNSLDKIPQEGLNSVAAEREVWVSLLDLLPPRPNLGKAVDNGWVDEWLTVCDVGGLQRTQCVRKQDRGITVLRPHNVLNQQLKQCNTSITHH